MHITCPTCQTTIEVNPATLMGGIKSSAKAATSKANGAKGGRPKGSKTKKGKKP